MTFCYNLIVAFEYRGEYAFTALKMAIMGVGWTAEKRKPMLEKQKKLKTWKPNLR